jgi:TPP-dependent pyruvate/acetoin dehydrogenase alpha subunit
MLNHGHTVESLIAFEAKVAAAFEAKQIRGPIHLCSDGQAEPLLGVFKDVRPDDWIFCTWRNHWHCLLKGMPEDELFDAICAGRSMFVCDKERRVVSSAIVGGILPIAMGVAMGIKRAGGSERGFTSSGSMPLATTFPSVWSSKIITSARTP